MSKDQECDICGLYGLKGEDKMPVEETIERVRRFSVEKEIPLNPHLIADLRSGLVPEDCVPTGPVALSIILSCYKVFCSSKALGAISDQSAKPIQILRNAGFVFDTDGGPNFVVRVDGVPGRRVSGFEAQPDRRAAALNLTRTERLAYIAGRRDPLTGMTQDMEIDHRQPVEASARLGEDYPDLTQALIDAGEADLYYQPLSKSTNIAKRGACHHCRNGEEIRVPETGLLIELATGQRYKRFFEDNLDHNRETGAPGCAGCFFFDCRLRMGMSQVFRNR